MRASLDTRLQNYAVNALRSGLVRYDRRHGWRGAKKQIELADWKKTLAALPNESGIETWKLAVALDYLGKDVRIGFADGSTGTLTYDGLQMGAAAVARRHLGAHAHPPRSRSSSRAMFSMSNCSRRPPSPVSSGLRQVPEINGAIVAMDPHTGRVLAMSGGFSYASSQFDRAMQAKRQPGSSFKPFVYAAALDNGYTPATKVLDAPFELDQGPGLPVWRPNNFEVGEYLGETTLRRGLELSRNVMTVRLASQVGMDKIVPYAIRFGVYDKMPPLLANSLGSYETTLLRMAAAYSEFVNGGKKVLPSLVDRIQGPQWPHHMAA